MRRSVLAVSGAITAVIGSMLLPATANSAERTGSAFVMTGEERPVGPRHRGAGTGDTAPAGRQHRRGVIRSGRLRREVAGALCPRARWAGC